MSFLSRNPMFIPTRARALLPPSGTYYPIQPPANTSSPHSFILISTLIDANSIAQIPIPSSYVTAIAISSTSNVLHIYNIFNPINSDLAFTNLNNWLNTAPLSCFTIWAGNFNKHHPSWSGHDFPKRCHCSDCELLLHHDFSLCLLPGSLTYQSDCHDMGPC